MSNPNPARIVADADVLAADVLVDGDAREAMDIVRNHSWVELVASNELLDDTEEVIRELADAELAADWRKKIETLRNRSRADARRPPRPRQRARERRSTHPHRRRFPSKRENCKYASGPDFSQREAPRRVREPVRPGKPVRRSGRRGVSGAGRRVTDLAANTQKRINYCSASQSANFASARPRWEMAFFSSVLISARVLPSCSKIGS